MLLMMWVESRCFPVRIPSAWMIRSVVSGQPATVVLHQANSEVV